MELLPIIYLVYIFVAIYFLVFYILIYVRNRKNMFSYPTTDKKYSVSVLVPAWNEEATIKDTIEHIFQIDYPVKELIVINDGSTDRTRKIVETLQKKYPKLKLINKKNSGKGDSINQGIKVAKGELVVVVDADSYPAKDSFGKMVGYFDDEKVGAATCAFIPRNNKTFFEKLQDVEYHVIAFTRKLLGYVDAIWVTPGPLAMYRKTALEKIGGFDPHNLTEDIEIAWALTGAGYKREMCLDTYATTTVPNKLKPWYRQRRRWNVGGLQCLSKYKKNFFKKGMLGAFILPLFTIQLFLGVVGLSVFLYVNIRKIISNYILTAFSIQVGIPVLTIKDIFITPSFLNYLGVILFIASFVFTIIILSIMKSGALKRQSIFSLLFYFLIYLSVYPIIMISAIYNFINKTYKWR